MLESFKHCDADGLLFHLFFSVSSHHHHITISFFGLAGDWAEALKILLTAATSSLANASAAMIHHHVDGDGDDGSQMGQSTQNVMDFIGLALHLANEVWHEFRCFM